MLWPGHSFLAAHSPTLFLRHMSIRMSTANFRSFDILQPTFALKHSSCLIYCIALNSLVEFFGFLCASVWGEGAGAMVIAHLDVINKLLPTVHDQLCLIVASSSADQDLWR